METEGYYIAERTLSDWSLILITYQVDITRGENADSEREVALATLA